MAISQYPAASAAGTGWKLIATVNPTASPTITASVSGYNRYRVAAFGLLLPTSSYANLILNGDSVDAGASKYFGGSQEISSANQYFSGGGNSTARLSTGVSTQHSFDLLIEAAADAGAVKYSGWSSTGPFNKVEGIYRSTGPVTSITIGNGSAYNWVASTTTPLYIYGAN